jgi:hypothetical protein
LEEHKARCESFKIPTEPTTDGERRGALGAMIVQLNKVVTLRGGKKTRYVSGFAVQDWIESLEQGPVSQIQEWEQTFKAVIDGKVTVEEIGYDDDNDTDEEMEEIPTPDNDD